MKFLILIGGLVIVGLVISGIYFISDNITVKKKGKRK